MSLDKAIKYRKEHRKPYYGAKSIDPWCRNHGQDDWSTQNRLFQFIKELERTNFYLNLYRNIRCLTYLELLDLE